MDPIKSLDKWTIPQRVLLPARSVLLHETIQRMRAIALVTGILEVALMVFVDAPGLESALADERWMARHYLMAHGLMALMALLFLLLSPYLRKKHGDLAFEGPIYWMITWMLVVNALIVGLDQLRTGQITAYIAIFFIVAMALHIRPPHHLFLYGLPHVVFLIFVFFFQQDPALRMANMVNGSLFVIFFMVATPMLYRSHLYRVANQMMLEEANEELKMLTRRDQLTGLLNRRTFEIECERLFEKNQHRGLLVVLDLDFFKSINDLYGHPFGDRVLMETAGRLKKALGDKDLLARWGGEEFIFYLQEREEEDFETRLERLRQALEATPLVIQGETLVITGSFGAVCLKERTLEEATKLADDAMYQAKAEGRNRWILVKGEDCATE